MFVHRLFERGYPKHQESGSSMMFSLYFTFGACLLLGARSPAGHRSLILFSAWSSLAHAAVMGYQGMRSMVARGELIGVGVLVVNASSCQVVFLRPSGKRNVCPNRDAGES